MTDPHGRAPRAEEPELRRQRWRLLRVLSDALERPLVVLAFVWLALLAAEFTVGLDGRLVPLVYGIWAIFILDFVVKFVIAPDRLAYLRGNWLTALSLILPALRVLRVFRIFRILRLARAVRSVSLLRLVTSLNRGMGALGRTFGRRGIPYVVALTAVVVLVGAAGMTAFESAEAVRAAGSGGFGADGAAIPGAGIGSYGDALWWTAMLMTTIGSGYSPQTVEGRILGWLLAVYALAIFGYLTATIASHFIGADAARIGGERGRPSPGGPGAVPGGEMAQPSVAYLEQEIRALRREVAALREGLLPPESSAGGGSQR